MLVIRTGLPSPKFHSKLEIKGLPEAVKLTIPGWQRLFLSAEIEINGVGLIVIGLVVEIATSA